MIDLSSLFDGEISQPEIERWLAQFEAADRGIVTRLLCHFQYFGRRQIELLVAQMAADILSTTGLPPTNVVVAVGADSSSYLAYQLAHVGGLTQVVAPADVGQYLSQEGCAVCVPENLIVFGSQAIRLWRSQFETGTPVRAKVILAASVAFEDGIKRIQASTGFEVVACRRVGEEILPFSPGSRVFSTEADRVEAERVIIKYCSRISPEHPLGYGGLGALLGFSHVTPNVTLPIFWLEGTHWSPLLRRQNQPSTQGVPSARRREEDAPHDVASLLSQALPEPLKDCLLFEFQGVQEAVLFAESAQSVGATPPVIRSFANLVRELAYHVHEREPVRSAILMAPDARAASKALGGLFYETDGNLDFGEVPEVVVLAEMLDGLSGSVLGDSGGSVLGNVDYGQLARESLRFQPHRYRRAAGASAAAGGLLAVFIGDGRVALLFRGERLLTRRGLTWYAHPADLASFSERLADKHGVRISTVQAVLELAFTLSDQEKGALITIGDHERVLAHRDKAAESHLRWAPKSVEHAPENAVCGLMACDGATILSSCGDIIDARVFLRPPADAPGEAEVGKGARHGTAVKISAITNAVCIAVSVDGEISIFSKGQKVLSAWA